jgi:Biotin-lipoyl like
VVSFIVPSVAFCITVHRTGHRASVRGVGAPHIKVSILESVLALVEHSSAFALSSFTAATEQIDGPSRHPELSARILNQVYDELFASGVQDMYLGENTMPPVRLFATAFIASAILTFGIFADPLSSDVPLASTAHAESKLDALIDPKLREWLDRLHKGAMPEGIAKTNGRIEATQIDVSAKYAGRLASVNVNEGDEVTAGQEIARISSPETEAQLRGAQAQELTAKQNLAEAEALIAERKSDLEFANNDVERGKPLVEKGYMTKQVFDQRVTKAEVAEAALHAVRTRSPVQVMALRARSCDLHAREETDLLSKTDSGGRYERT